MIRVGGKVTGGPQTISTIQQLPGLLRQAGEAAMRESLELVSTIIRDDFLSGPYPEFIERRAGRFRATWRRGDPDNIFEVHSRGTVVTGILGSQDIRARILDEGGILRATHSQFLAVRSDFTKTPRGVVREKYRGPLRGIPNTFVRPIRARRAVAAVFERMAGRVVAIAWLVPWVEIIGRKYREKTEAKARPRIPPIFAARFQAILDRLNQTLRRVGR